MPPRIAAVGSDDRAMMIENPNSGQDGETEIAERFPRMDHVELSTCAPILAITAADHSPGS